MTSRVLMQMPAEVFHNYIFPHLKLGDLHRLGRVCKRFKNLCESYTRNHLTDQQMEINESDSTFGDIVCDGPLSIFDIYINNGTLDCFDDQCISDFLKIYARQITHLRVGLFACCVSEAEKVFYSSLTCLEHLEVDKIDTKGWVGEAREARYFPPNFRNIKTLKLNQVQNNLSYALDLITFCTSNEFEGGTNSKLKCLQFPCTANASDGMYDFLEKFVGDVFMDFPGPPSLKYFDFRNCQPGSLKPYEFQWFAMWCHREGMRLLNVDIGLCEAIPECPGEEENIQKIATTILSMKNLWAYFLKDDLPQLEKLKITNTSKCTFGEFWSGERPEWRNLKFLDVTIDSVKLKIFGHFVQESTSTLIQFLFASVHREKLTDLSIRFDKNRETLGDLPCPRAHDIVVTCINVTKFTLTNWLGTNKAVSKFWSGLPHLEEVEMDECRMLADVAFVGENREDPTFLKLKKLKKLTLRGMELMPKVTDLAFELVFCHLRIKQLFLFSTDPMQSVTTKGIRYLLTGEFNGFVEKFPFRGWSLHGVSKEEMMGLKSEFRASCVL